MAISERLAAMKAKQEAAEKAASEKAKAETEVKREGLSAEREKVGAELASAEQTVSEAKNAVAEAEAFVAEQGANLDPEAKAEVDGIIAEAAQANEQLQTLKAEMQRIDTELAGLSEGTTVEAAPVAEPSAEVAVEATPTAKSVAEKPAAPKTEDIDEGWGTADTAVAKTDEIPVTLEEPTEVAPPPEPVKVEKAQPTPEESAKAMEELQYSLIHTADSAKDQIKDDISIEGIVDGNEQSTRRFEALQKTLVSFENKTPDSLTKEEKAQLKEAMTKAYGETYYARNAGKYDAKGETAIQRINKNIDSFVQNDKAALDEMKAEVATLKGEPTTDRVGRVDLKQMKEKLDSISTADKDALMKKLQAAITKGEQGLQNANKVVEKNNEAFKKGEPVLRASEKVYSDTVKNLLDLHDKMRKQFAPIFE